MQAYHTAADRLQLIPATAKYASGVHFEVSLDRSGATATDIINVDLKVLHDADACVQLVPCARQNMSSVVLVWRI